MRVPPSRPPQKMKRPSPLGGQPPGTGHRNASEQGILNEGEDCEQHVKWRGATIAAFRHCRLLASEQPPAGRQVTMTTVDSGDSLPHRHVLPEYLSFAKLFEPAGSRPSTDG